MAGPATFAGGQAPCLAGVAPTAVPRDHPAEGPEDPSDPQSALKILQRRLESFQTFRQQTLENIDTVRTKIHEILTENVFERKTPLRSSDEILMTCTPSDASLAQLSSANGECKRLSTAVTNAMEENQSLKKELQEYRRDASKYDSDIRKLNEERLQLEKLLWTTANERDVLQLKFCNLRNDYISLLSKTTDSVRRPGHSPVVAPCNRRVALNSCISTKTSLLRTKMTQFTSYEIYTAVSY